VVALALVATTVGACSSRGDEDGGPASTTTGAAPRVEVEVVPAGGARLSTHASVLPVLVLDGALVAVGDGAVAPGRADPLLRSTDDGRTWTVPRTPDADPGDLSTWSLHEVDGLGILAGGVSTTLAPPQPVLWVSDDDGATFTAGAGVADGAVGGTVREVVALDDRLVALGDVQVDGSPVARPATWTSTDRGRTWVRTLPGDGGPGGPEGGGAAALVLVGGRLLAPTGDGIVASDDAGRTWEPIDVPTAPGHRIVDLLSDGGVVVVTTSNSYSDPVETAMLSSTDAGTTWRRSAPLPGVRDRDGTGTTLNAPSDLHRLPTGDLVATTSTAEDYDRYLPYVLRSTDEGRTWEVADLGQDCPSYEASARLSPLATAGPLLVAVYECVSRRRAQLLASVDGGRTWTEARHPALRAIRVGAPFTSGDGRVSVLGGDGTHRSVVHLTVRR